MLWNVHGGKQLAGKCTQFTETNTEKRGQWNPLAKMIPASSGISRSWQASNYLPKMIDDHKSC